MSGFDGNGVWTRSYSFVQDAANGLKISSSRFDTELANVTAGFNICMTRDGQGKPSAAMDWNGQNLGNVNQLTVTGAATFGGNVTLTGNLSVAGMGTFSAAETVTGALTVAGLATFANVTATGSVSLTTVTLNNLFTLDGGATVGALSGTNLQIYGNTATGGNANTIRFLTASTARYILGVKLTASGAGVVPNFASAAMTGGSFFVQAIGADPTAAPGDIVFEY